MFLGDPDNDNLWCRSDDESQSATALNLEQTIQTACLLECSAPKVGNVTPKHAFEDLSHDQFVRSAPITARWICRATELGVGPAVEGAATDIMRSVRQNTHLGILLLLSPLAACSDRDGLPRLLQSLTIDDARCVYRAIRVMEPGGMGDAEEQDVRDEPTATLLECMRLAADRDSIARQYASGFADVFRFADEVDSKEFGTDWRSAALRLQLQIMFEMPDTLIARKCGDQVAAESARRAREVLDRGVSDTAVRSFDNWLRADGHRRNPGTTADLIAAILFVALREQRISVPPEIASEVLSHA